MRRTLADLLHAGLLLTACALAAWLSIRWQTQFDWSHGARASLSTMSREALTPLKDPVAVVSYARKDGQLRAAIAGFVARYQRLKPDLSLEFVDPDSDPAAMRKRGIVMDGELEVSYGERHERLTELNERTFTGALLRLARPQDRVAVFLIGHGERRVEGGANHDWSHFGAALREQGIRAVTLNLAEQPVLPENIDLLVIADPRSPFTDDEKTVLHDYLDGGGALLWLAEPGDNTDLQALGTTLGVHALPGTVVDSAGQAMGIGDPSFVAVTRYPDHPATKGFELTTVLPQSAALAAIGGASFAPMPLLRSGERSWTETGDIADSIAYDRDTEEVPGPHDLALALTRLSPRPGRTEQRAIVIGDADFLANSFLANGGNKALGLRLFNWLLADDALIDLKTPEAPDRDLVLSPRAMAVIAFGFLIGLPVLLLATGALIAWRRRRG